MYPSRWHAIVLAIAHTEMKEAVKTPVRGVTKFVHCVGFLLLFLLSFCLRKQEVSPRSCLSIHTLTSRYYCEYLYKHVCPFARLKKLCPFRHNFSTASYRCSSKFTHHRKNNRYNKFEIQFPTINTRIIRVAAPTFSDK